MPRRHREIGDDRNYKPIPTNAATSCSVSLSLSGLCVSVANYFEKRLAAKLREPAVANGSLTAKALAEEI